jgi:hypothetical protein
MYGIKISLGCRLEKNVLSGRGKVGLYGSLLGIVKFELYKLYNINFEVKLS